MRLMAVTRVYVDCDSYLKIGSNHKRKGSNCWAHQALFALRMTTIWRLRFLRLRHTRRGQTLTIATLLANTRANTHTNTKRRNDVPHPKSMLLRLYYLQNANPMLVLFWAPSRKFVTIILKAITHFLNSVARPPENSLFNCTYALHKFGNPSYHHRSHMLTSSDFASFM